MYLLDYIRKRWVRKGPMVEIGIPPESRPDKLPVNRALISRHLAACAELSQNEATLDALLTSLNDPLFIQTGGRALAQQLIAAGKIQADPEALVQLLHVLTGEITRQMYIASAQSKPGAIGIRLFAEKATSDAATLDLIEQDHFGLGKGVYPFDQVPVNPTPGKRCGFYVRVATAPPSH